MNAPQPDPNAITPPGVFPDYNENTVPGPEYRVRTVARYIVTRYCHPFESKDGKYGQSGSSSVIAEFCDEQQAFQVAQALAAQEPGGTVSV